MARICTTLRYGPKASKATVSVSRLASVGALVGSGSVVGEAAACVALGAGCVFAAVAWAGLVAVFAAAAGAVFVAGCWGDNPGNPPLLAASQAPTRHRTNTPTMTSHPKGLIRMMISSVSLAYCSRAGSSAGWAL